MTIDREGRIRIDKLRKQDVDVSDIFLFAR